MQAKTYKCNKCNAVFTIVIDKQGDIVPYDCNYFACCPLCSHTGYRALDQIQ
jgi:hypothetical protein